MSKTVIKGWARRLTAALYRHTMRRIVATYIAAFCLPLCVLLALYYHRVQLSLGKEYLSQLSAEASQAESLYRDRISGIVSIESLLSQNVPFCAYLDAPAAGDAERVYNYLVYVKPQLDYILRTNSLVQEVNLYSLNPGFISPPYRFYDSWPQWELPLEEIMGQQDPRATCWKLLLEGDACTGATCYLRIFDPTYSRVLMVVCLRVDLPRLLTETTAPFSSTGLSFELQGQRFLLSGGKLLRAGPGEAAAGQKHRFAARIFSQFPLPELEGTVCLSKEYSLLARENIWLFFAPVLAFVALLASLFLVFLSSGVRRILDFSRSLAGMGRGRLQKYPPKGVGDEIDQLIAAYNALVDSNNALINDVYQMRIQNREAQFYALQAQIKPHFLMNTLENIRMMAQINRDKPTAEMVLMLGKMFRYNLVQGDSCSTIDQELLHACNYLELCRMRLGARLCYTIEGADEGMAAVVCPRNIVQPVVENCINHGFRDTYEACRIRIRLRDAGNGIVLRIEDNGCGFLGAALQSLRAQLAGGADAGGGPGIGLANVSQRLRLFYGEGYGVKIFSAPGGGAVCALHIGKRLSK